MWVVLSLVMLGFLEHGEQYGAGVAVFTRNAFSAVALVREAIGLRVRF
jgi:hypothetical protein